VSGNDSIKADYSKQFSQYKKLKVEIEKLKAEYEKNRQEEDYIQFQLDQIAALKLQENEDEELEREQSRLSNVNEIKQCLWSASSVLQDEDNSIVSQLSVLSRSFLQIENVDADLKELSERLQSLMIELKDFSRTISSIQDSYVDDPNELERINERLNNIYDLENKHKLSCVNELIALQHSYEEKLAVITNSDDEIKRLEEKLIIVEKEARAKAKELSLSRRKGAEIFKQELEKTAIPLGMKNLRFEIGFEDCELCAQGMDKVEFLFAFNKQQQLMPIENTASGGELSRVMLCIKAIIAQNMQLPTIIFDEVDTGVSGEIAHKMGEMMGDISNNIQVIAITHLPQVAVKGNNHLKVYKADIDEATYTSMCELTKEERVEEIARMLSGREIDAAAINNARSLLGY
jgi:DNA repair protein RecN (Recombination protein N)